jgi:hypothetical protein
VEAALAVKVEAGGGGGGAGNRGAAGDYIYFEVSNAAYQAQKKKTHFVG